MFPEKSENPKGVFPADLWKIVAVILIPVIIFSAVAAFLAVTRQGSFLALTSFEDDVLAEASLQGIDISKVVGVYYLFMIVLLTASFFFSHSRFGVIQSFGNMIRSKAESIFSGTLSGRADKHYQAVWFVIMSIIPIVYNLHFRTGEYRAIAATVFLCITALLLSRFGDIGLISSAVTVLVVLAAVCFPFAAFENLFEAGSVIMTVIAFLILSAMVISKKSRRFQRPVMECALILPWLLLLIRQLKIHDAGPVLISILTVLPFAYISVRMILNKNEDKPSADLVAVSFISVVFAGALTALFGKYTPNLFEGSNHGYAIYDTVKNGSFPILENFDAHMLSNYLPGLIDAFISGEIHYSNQGVGYELYLFFGLLLHYAFFRCFYDKDASLMLLFFAPLSLLNYKTATINSSEHVMVLSLALILVFRKWWEKQSAKYDIYLWLAMAFSVVFSLEIGASFGVATLITACFAILTSKDKRRIASFFISGACVAMACLAAVFILCHMHDLKIKNVISQFMYAAFSSNQNWAFGVFSKPRELIGIACVYVLMPLAVIPFVICSMTKMGEKRNITKYIAVIVLLAFLLNLSRTIVRHTIFDRYSHFIWMLALLLIISLKEYKRPVRFLIPGISLMLLLTFEFSIWGTTVLPATNAAGGFLKLDFFVIEDTAKKDTAGLNKAMNMLLDEDQTYIDFTNNTLLYQYVGKDKPVYVNQSPALVSGKAAQKEFISETERYEKEAAVVLMPAEFGGLASSMDNVLNTDRFFLISTYINQNYSPLCIIDAYAIWAKNTLYPVMQKRAEGIENIKKVSDLSYMQEGFFRHSLQNIPYLWGTYGNAGNEMLSGIDPYDEGEIPKVIDEISSYEGAVYCRINISADHEGYITMIFSEDETGLCTEYSYILKPGTNEYAFCVSSDMLWSTCLFNRLSVEADTDYKINGLYFTGDVISK